MYIYETIHTYIYLHDQATRPPKNGYVYPLCIHKHL